MVDIFWTVFSWNNFGSALIRRSSKYFPAGSEWQYNITGSWNIVNRSLFQFPWYLQRIVNVMLTRRLYIGCHSSKNEPLVMAEYINKFMLPPSRSRRKFSGIVHCSFFFIHGQREVCIHNWMWNSDAMVRKRYGSTLPDGTKSLPELPLTYHYFCYMHLRAISQKMLENSNRKLI